MLLGVGSKGLRGIPHYWVFTGYLKIYSEMSKTGLRRECDWLQSERNVVSKGDNLSLLLLGFFS
jgi:hypothetical protein